MGGVQEKCLVNHIDNYVQRNETLFSCTTPLKGYHERSKCHLVNLIFLNCVVVVATATWVLLDPRFEPLEKGERIGRGTCRWQASTKTASAPYPALWRAESRSEIMDGCLDGTVDGEGERRRTGEASDDFGLLPEPADLIMPAGQICTDNTRSSKRVKKGRRMAHLSGVMFHHRRAEAHLSVSDHHLHFRSDRPSYDDELGEIQRHRGRAPLCPPSGQTKSSFHARSPSHAENTQ